MADSLRLTAYRSKLKTYASYLLGFLLAGGGLWFATRGLEATAVLTALQQAQLGPILLATAVITLTLVAKAWRWHMLFHPRHTAPPFPQVARTLFTAQFLNQALPVARLGDISRLFLLDLNQNLSKSQILGTIVLEKTLDLITLSLTLLLILPFLALPDTINQPSLLLGLTLVASFILYLLAYQTPLVIRVVHQVSRLLPTPLQAKLLNVVAAGLEGLATLRHPATAVSLLLLSAVIGLLSILTPFILFAALGLQDMGANIFHAALLNIVLAVGSLPVSVPGHVGIFEALVVFTLTPFTTADPAVIFSYALIFHLVAIIPIIIIGGLATARSGLRLPALWHKPAL